MLYGKQTVIISRDQLQCIGLKTILQEFFNAESVITSQDFNSKVHECSPDFLFLPSDIYLAHGLQVKGIKSRIIILTNYTPAEGMSDNPYMLNITSSQPELIEQLQMIFNDNVEVPNGSPQEELSGRETEVLKLVARGFINKQIADMLNISLHTVISHRKNITRKLGIKTVSGLTVYALLNRLITSEEIE